MRVTVVLVLIAVAALVIWGLTLWAARGRRRRMFACLGDRPGWSGTQFAPGVRDRYRVHSPFGSAKGEFSWLMSGPVPGGGEAETFVYEIVDRTGKGISRTGYTVATVVFPYPLPALRARPVRDAGEAAERLSVGNGQAQMYDESSFGPLWQGLHGYAPDQAAARVFRPEILDRTRTLELTWWFDGRVAIGVTSGIRGPQRMLALVDALAEFGAAVPAEARRAPADGTEPWAGPTPEHPA
jgi:hypothetical protein